jgi:histone acetyltransferase
LSLAYAEDEKKNLLERSKVLGGMCFRPFHSQGFAEIVFLAVEEASKHRGLGTQIMNHVKEHVKKEDIKYFLTYADNTAIGYFVKQGFSKKKTMVRSRWEGFIKDYVRSTLMECKILYNVNYVTFKQTLQAQRAVVLNRISKVSKAHIVREGLDPNKHYSVEEIPGVLEAGWNSSMAAGTSSSSRFWGVDSSLTAQLGHVLKVIFSLKCAVV